MKKEQIGIQFYTLRDAIKTPAGFADACHKVSDIGYRCVQISGVDFDKVPRSEVVKMCADHGLTICASHEPSDSILSEPQRVAERVLELGADLTAYPYPAGIDFSDERAVTAFIAALDAAGSVMKSFGVTLTYHNHHHEFRKLGGKILLERIYEETQASNLQGEIDTYWVQYGGGNPVSWLTKLAGRLPILHLKDYRINSDNAVEFAEVGAGNLDFPAIVNEARKSDCKWFVVEQDTCPGDPFISIRQSFDYLATLAVG